MTEGAILHYSTHACRRCYIIAPVFGLSNCEGDNLVRSMACRLRSTSMIDISSEWKPPRLRGRCCTVYVVCYRCLLHKYITTVFHELYEIFSLFFALEEEWTKESSPAAADHAHEAGQYRSMLID